MVKINVSGFIRRDDEVLLIEFDDTTGLHYNLPGGSLEEGETLEAGVRREVREEAGVDVTVGQLLLVWEYIPVRGEYRYGLKHKIGLIYECTLRPGNEPRPNYRHDTDQTGVRWKPLAELATLETVAYFGEKLLAVVQQKGEP
jgi:8-oxo-dGTP diphosphatase